MKSVILTSTVLCVMIIASCNSGQTPAVMGSSEDSVALADTVSVNPDAYDSLLAQELGADEYGMKPYVMAFLKEGPDRDQDSATAAQLQADHMANINRMAEEGTLVLAGPFLGDGDLRGIYLFNVATIEEAEALTNTDPAVQAGRLVMELQMWYGSAALLQVNDLHKKIAKENH